MSVFSEKFHLYLFECMRFSRARANPIFSTEFEECDEHSIWDASSHPVRPSSPPKCYKRVIHQTSLSFLDAASASPCILSLRRSTPEPPNIRRPPPVSRNILPSDVPGRVGPKSGRPKSPTLTRCRVLTGSGSGRVGFGSKPGSGGMAGCGGTKGTQAWCEADWHQYSYPVPTQCRADTTPRPFLAL
jgi:hypothetical protein